MIVEAPAKINLTLEVTELEDNGYHRLDTLFVWLTLADSIDIRPASRTSLMIQGEQFDSNLIESDESNLVLRALRSLETLVGRELPVEIVLTKRIPAGGGLGGGSADAAATLFALDHLFGLNLGQAALLEIARKLGADVAFGLVGGFCRGTRYGDVLESLPFPKGLRDRELVLVFPEVSCPTPAVFREWDQFPSTAAAGSTARFLDSQDTSLCLKAVANDLEEPAFRCYPRLSSTKRSMLEAGLSPVCLSGSGSTLFGFLSEEQTLEGFEKEFRLPGVQWTVTNFREGGRYG